MRVRQWMGAKSSSQKATESQQSSVLFSLKELQSIEESRVEEERRAIEAKEQTLERLRLDGLERKRAEEEARLAVEEERRRQEASLRLQEEVRNEAMRIAAIERVQFEVLSRARIEAAAQTQDHERRLLELKNDVEKRRLRRNIVTVTVLGLIAIAASLVIYLGAVRPQAVERERALAEEARKQSDEAARLRAEGEDRDAKIHALLAEKNAPVTLPGAPPPPTVAPPRPPPPRPPPIKKDVPCTASNDPLNGCLH